MPQEQAGETAQRSNFYQAQGVRCSQSVTRGTAAGLTVAVEADDEGAGGFVAGGAIAAGSFAGDIADVAGFEKMWLALAAELDGAFEDVDHLDAGVAFGVEAGAVIAGEELGEAGAECRLRGRGCRSSRRCSRDRASRWGGGRVRDGAGCGRRCGRRTRRTRRGPC